MHFLTAAANTTETSDINVEVSNFITFIVQKSVDIGFKLLAAIAVFVIGRTLIKFIMKRIRKSRFAKKSDTTVVTIINNFISITLYIVLAISIIAIMGVPMASIVAVIASCGLAIGLALQGALSNIAGGIMILFFRPFRIGDFIQVAGETGTVTDIGIFYTVLTTPDNKVITIPNGKIMSDSITDYSHNDTRRVDFVFSVAYGTEIERVRRILLDEADKHELVLEDPAPFCRFSKHNDSSLDFTLRVWTNSTDYWQVYFDILQSVNDKFVSEGIEIPFKQMDVHIQNS